VLQGKRFCQQKKKEKDLSGRRGYEFSEESGVLINFGII